MNETLNEQAREELVYTLSRSEWLTGWWSWALALAVLAVLIAGMLRLYRRDTSELPGATRWSLILLRLALIGGLVVFAVGIERRARQRVTRPSEVAVLLDTSQSMSLPQDDSPGGATRMEAVSELVSQTPLIESLATDHRVTLYTFDATGELNEVLVSSPSDLNAQTVKRNENDVAAVPRGRSLLAVVGAVLLAIALFGMVLASGLLWFKQSSRGPAVLLGSVICLVIGGGVLGGVWTVETGRELAELVGLNLPGAARGDEQGAEIDPAAADSGDSEGEETETTRERLQGVDWESVLVAAGPETRLGDALRSTLGRHDPATLAGVLLLTDGQSNGGTPPINVASLVGRGGTAIYPIGFGSSKPPINVRIVDLDAPRRVYPGDKFSLSAVLQGSGPEPMTVQVQLYDAADLEGAEANGETADGEAGTAGLGELVDSQEVEVPGDGTLTGVQFEMKPEAVGRRRLAVRVSPPLGDQNDTDNERAARYEVVSRRLRTLMVAGGPMREYRFVRNLLYRDESIEVDVWLQTGQPGMSQDADNILTAFPSTPEALFQYDAILAFDPDWTLLNANQLNLLETWLSQQAGGLVLISGPVYMPEWMRQRTDPRVDLVRDFYPVRLPNRGPLLTAGRTGGDTAWPLQTAPDALRADFLRLDDNQEATAAAWAEFGGVYDYVGVQEAKPGAKVYAYFSDPSAAIDDQAPVYLASQFYGAGRVYFQGSGEMWRLRGVSVPYFDAYYTKLVRWVSEGRLLRDSKRGILLVDRPRAMVGDTITVRAILMDEQFQPLRVPQVEAKLLTPSGRIETVRLTPLQGEPREGTYTGRFVVREPGAHEVRVTLGNALEEEVLRQPVQASLPTLELERPRRNDEVLEAIAATTGGRYLPIGTPAVSGGSGATGSAASGDVMGLVGEIEPQPQLTILPGTPDRDFQRRHNASLMWLLCTLLTMEWMVRRLNRLA